MCVEKNALFFSFNLVVLFVLVQRSENCYWPFDMCALSLNDIFRNTCLFSTRGIGTLAPWPWCSIFGKHSQKPDFMQVMLSKHQGSSTSPMPITSLQALPSSHYITSLCSGLTSLILKACILLTGAVGSHWNPEFHLSPSAHVTLPWPQLECTTFINWESHDLMWRLSALQHFFH